MDYQELGSQIVALVGGKENVSQLDHCVTRLRFRLVDEEKAATDEIKALDPVMAVVRMGGQYQVVLGKEVVPTYDAIVSAYGFSGGEVPDDDVPKERLFEGTPKDIAKRIWNGIIGYLAGTMVSIVPLFIGCGLINCIISVATLYLGLDKASDTYHVLYAVANAPFYFLPVLVGFSASRQMKCNPMLGAILGLMLMHPSFTGLAENGATAAFFGIPFPTYSYASTVFPVLLGVWMLGWLEPRAYGFLPAVVKSVFGPFICILVMAPVMVLVLGPVGYGVGQLLAQAVLSLTYLPFGIGCGMLSAFQQILVIFGAHTVLAPPMITAIESNGFDALIRPAFIMGTMANMGAVLGVASRCRSKELRGVALSAAVTSFIGASEPGLYGVLVPLAKPMVATCIGAFCGGVVSYDLGARAYAMGKNGVFGWLVFNETIPAIIIASAVAAAAAFLLVRVLGFDESRCKAKS